MKKLNFFFVLKHSAFPSLLLFLVAQVSHASHASQVLQGSRTLAPGSQLKFSSDKENALNGVFELDWNGDAEAPLCGRTRLKGLDPEDARRVMRSCLSRFFQRLPEFTIEEIFPRMVAVKIGFRGEAARVTRVAEKMSVQSISAREGLQAAGDNLVRILSPYGLDVVALGSSPVWNQPFHWQGGETILIEREDVKKPSETFDVLGEVRKPGQYSYRPSTAVIDVLREAQGPTPQASFDSVLIYRKTSGKKIEVSWDDKLSKIEPGDIVIVPSQRETLLDKSLRWTGSTLAIVNTLFLILLARR